ncbi:hypothetical protein ABLE91_01430 [Aquabacter sp. CN5-332]|uniref:hypothetical protein n=1 Tax=Aquabacter sp. CN5-332 TaxID=3156608 RepID=UPI0032B380C4
MPKGLLLVSMEPPATLEDEFNDWYDTEHFPQRRVLPGFESASRWVCLAGWPRWLALYDLSSVAALETPDYAAVSGERSTPWSKRVLPRTIGRRRVIAEQMHPGDAVMPPSGEVARLCVAHFPHAGTDPVSTLVRAAEGSASPVYLRLFRDVPGGGIWSLATFAHPVSLEQAAVVVGAGTNGGAKLLNLYAPYMCA